MTPPVLWQPPGTPALCGESNWRVSGRRPAPPHTPLPGSPQVSWVLRNFGHWQGWGSSRPFLLPPHSIASTGHAGHRPSPWLWCPPRGPHAGAGQVQPVPSRTDTAPKVTGHFPPLCTKQSPPPTPHHGHPRASPHLGLRPWGWPQGLTSKTPSRTGLAGARASSPWSLQSGGQVRLDRALGPEAVPFGLGPSLHVDTVPRVPWLLSPLGMLGTAAPRESATAQSLRTLPDLRCFFF